jgi:hypothetical protein
MNDAHSAFRADTLLPILCCATALLLSSADTLFAQPIGNPEPLRIQDWQGWENLQGTPNGADCVSIAPNAIDCFSHSSGDLMWHRRWDGATWLPWTPAQGVVMEGYVDSKPDCVSASTSRIDCFVRADADKALYHRFWEGNVVSGWEALGGTLTSDPECVSADPRQIDCYARGSSGELLHRHFDGDIWAQWENLGGQIAEGTKPGCASPGQGRIDCVVVWTDQGVRHRRFGTAPTAWSQVSGGTIIGPDSAIKSPKCYASPSANRVDCVAPYLPPSGGYGSLVRLIFDSQNSSSAISISNLGSDFGRAGPHNGQPVKFYDWDCVERSNERLDCMELVVWGTTSYLVHVPGATFLRHLSLTPIGSPGWIDVTLATNTVTEPRFIDCVSWDGERIDCFTSGWTVTGYQAPLGHASYAWHRVTLPPKPRPFPP